MLSIELLLDDATEDAVRSEWRALQERGIPSLMRHTGDSNRPHVTLLVTDRMERCDVAPIRDAVGLLPIPLMLGGVVVFGEGGRGFVLARSVVVTDALLGLHRAVHHASAGLVGDVAPLSRPDAWTPHVTIARRLPARQVGDALEVIGARALPPGSAVGARLWDGTAKTVTPLA